MSLSPKKPFLTLGLRKVPSPSIPSFTLWGLLFQSCPLWVVTVWEGVSASPVVCELQEGIIGLSLTSVTSVSLALHRTGPGTEAQEECVWNK